MALDDREALANAYWIRAIAETERGGPAHKFFELALPIFEEFGLLQMQVRVLNNMAMRAFYVSEWETRSSTTDEPRTWPAAAAR